MVYKGEQRGVFIAHGFPIDAIHCGRKEEIAHLPPAFEIDLAPLCMSV